MRRVAAVLVVALACTLSVAARAEEPAAAPAQRFEYRVVEISTYNTNGASTKDGSAGRKMLVKTTNQLGAEGWRLASTTVIPNAAMLLFFERPLAPGAPAPVIE